MAIDFLNSYQRKDSASASNVYYGYSYNQNAGDGDFVWSIRRDNTSAGVESFSWANGDAASMYSSWTNRAAYFAAPTASLGLTWSTSTNVVVKTMNLSWDLLNGVDRYIITSKTNNGQLLDSRGNAILGPNTFNKTYTDFVLGVNNFSLSFIDSGTYSITLTALNAGGSTSSTATINFA